MEENQRQAFISLIKSPLEKSYRDYKNKSDAVKKRI